MTTSRSVLAPYLPARPLTAEKRKLFDQYIALAYRQAGRAMTRYCGAETKAVQNAALIGLMYAAERYETPSAASFSTFALRTIDWTILNVMRAELGMNRYRKKHARKRQASFEPSAYRATGDLPETRFDVELDEHAVVETRTPEDIVDEKTHEALARSIMGELAKNVTPRNLRILERSLNGETLQCIANDVGLTRERVRQLVMKMYAHARQAALRVA